ncbi:MAG: 4-hydroxy-tetrahydrodipicolinate reductase [Halobacteriaceae archaeon]
MRLAVTGATGRMGRAVVETAAERGHEVVLAVNRDPPDEVAGVPVEPPDRLPALLAEREPDALVDFTGPESSVAYVEACAEVGVPAVVGTTGFDDEQAARIEAAAAEVPVLRAANFARGVQALVRAVREAVGDLPGYDIEVTETHHNAKRDAPSGTAKELLAAIEAERETGARVHGREGEAPRQQGEVGVHARRAGDITGEHEVLLAGNHEALTLTHRAESRGVFAAGALDAAAWLRERDPGFYAFGDVLADP